MDDTYKQDKATPQLSESTRLLLIITKAWSWVFLALILVFFEVWSQIEVGRSFLWSTYNLQSLGVAAVQILMLALGLTLVIVASHIDLSIGFITGLAAVMAAVLIRLLDPFTNDLYLIALDMTLGAAAEPLKTMFLGDLLGVTVGQSVSVVIAIAGAAAIAMVPGLINGWMVSKLKVPSFIGTLGMYGIARGVALLIAGGATVSIQNDVARDWGNGTHFEVPYIVVFAILCAVAFHYLLSSTRFGVYTYAIGGNYQAAVRAGVRVDRHLIILFMLSALTAGFGGIIYTMRFSAGAAQAGEPILLYAVAAVFIGGASLTGGKGTVVGTVIGALIIAVIQFGLVFINVAPYWQFVAVGGVIIIAVLIDQSRSTIDRLRSTS